MIPTMPRLVAAVPRRPALVGRDAERDRLRAALDEARAGWPGSVLIGGEAGIGKTRLVQELVAAAEEAGCLTLTGHCSPTTGDPLGYGPFVDILGQLWQQMPDVPQTVTPEVWRSLTALTGGSTVPAGTGIAVARLFAGFSQLLAAVSLQQPVLVVIEDVHWADDSSLDLLTFFARS